MSKGFTLIELSIVLVIIGLLIGGVLVAQSLISSTKISSQISQIQQFDTAVANFETRYNSLPGDSNIFSVTGDNDGNIEGAPGSENAFTAERALFWNHLSISGLNPHDGGTTYSSSFASGVDVTGTDANTPKAILGKNAAVVIQYDAGNWIWNSSMVTGQSYGYEYYTIADCSTTTQATDTVSLCQINNSAIGIDFLAVDVKIDDGNVGAGNIFASIERVGMYEAYDNGTFASNSSVTSDPDAKVAGFIRIGSMVGNPK